MLLYPISKILVHAWRQADTALAAFGVELSNLDKTQSVMSEHYQGRLARLARPIDKSLYCIASTVYYV